MEQTCPNGHLDSNEFEDFDDSLSFCHLSFPAREIDEPFKPPHQYIEEEDVFEFSTSVITTAHSFHVDSFVFCGKLIPDKSQDDAKFECFYARGSSLLPSTSQEFVKKGNRSKSLHVQNLKTSPCPPVTCKQPSGNSRKHKALIGLAKIPTKMELTDMKKRQSRFAEKLVSAPPSMVDDKKRVLAGNEGAGDVHSRLFKPFRCRDYFARALAKCIRFVKT